MSQQNKEIMLFDGYLYRLDRRNVDSSPSWRCVNQACPCHLKQNEDDAITAYRNCQSCEFLKFLGSNLILLLLILNLY